MNFLYIALGLAMVSGISVMMKIGNNLNNLMLLSNFKESDYFESSLPSYDRRILAILESYSGPDTDVCSNIKEKIKDTSYEDGDLLIIMMSGICVFVGYHVDLIINYVGGSEFYDSKRIIILFLVWTVYRVRSHFSMLMIESFEDTRILKKINVITYAIGVPLVFFFVSPRSLFGLELGAFGVCLKILIIQQIFNLLLMRNISSRLNSNLWFKYFSDHFFILIFILIIFVSRKFLFLLSTDQVFSFLVNSVIYSIFLLFVIFAKLKTHKEGKILLENFTQPIKRIF